MLRQKEAPPDMQCKDMLRIQSIVARPGVTAKDITSEMVTTNTKLFLYINISYAYLAKFNCFLSSLLVVS
jgi:hypothetical protein